MKAEADKILEMIKSVDPRDDGALDEIDVRTWCYLEKYTLENFDVECAEFTVKEREGHFGYDADDPCDDWVSYTRSRDALKAIRPEGFTFRSFQDINLNWQCGLYKPRQCFVGGMSLWFSTEELAELHAIIQAIKYERQGNV